MANIKKYLTKVIAIHSQIKGVYTLELKSIDKPFKYESGQFLHLALDEYDPSKQWPDSRCFSMQSNPSEKNIKITYSVKGKFTSYMEQHILVGTEVWLKLPYGDLFKQPHNKENTVFIAGGAGITPFLSLFTHESFNTYINPRIYLGFRSEKYNIYHEEITRACNSSMSLKYFYENTNGGIDIQSIFNFNSINSYYFISGPPMMINAFKLTLIENGVILDHILTDKWE